MARVYEANLKQLDRGMDFPETPFGKTTEKLQDFLYAGIQTQSASRCKVGALGRWLRDAYSQVPGVARVRDGLRLRGRLHGLLPGLHRDDGSFDHVLQRDKDVVVLEPIGWEALRMKLPGRVFHQIRPHAI